MYYQLFFVIEITILFAVFSLSKVNFTVIDLIESAALMTLCVIGADIIALLKRLNDNGKI